MTRRRTERPEPDSEGVIEEIPLQDASSGMANSWRDRALLVMAVVAVGGGLLIAGANAIGLMGEPNAARNSQGAAPSAAATATVRPKPTEPPVAELWQLTAESHRDNYGGVFRYQCPPGGAVSNVYGFGIYTDNSSVCTAAVHWGSLTLQEGGSVTIQILATIDHYSSVAANGILSQDADATDASFVFVQEDAPSGPWSTGAVGHRGDIGQRFDYRCPPGGTPAQVWGTRIYTDDSSVCTAAVHAGLITFEQGGSVTIEIRAGRREYPGSVQNHVVSADWGRWDGSYVFVAIDG